MDFQNIIEELILKSQIHINIEKLNELTKHISELIRIKNQYRDKLSILRLSADKDVARFEYSKGGKTIHRGYYCPSIVFDLIVGNCKRGRLLKKKPEFGKYTYEYAFNRDNQLIRIRNVDESVTPDSCFYEEHLIYEDNIVYGLEFNSSDEVIVVSKCTYELGNIIKYERSLCFIEEQADLHFEEYKYKNSKPSEVTIFFNVMPSISLYTESRYLIEHNENGHITKLTGGDIVNGNWNKREYIIK